MAGFLSKSHRTPAHAYHEDPMNGPGLGELTTNCLPKPQTLNLQTKAHSTEGRWVVMEMLVPSIVHSLRSGMARLRF